jgi:hypothetical protein
LESTNLVNEEAPPFYRACQGFHEESTCPVFFQVNEQGFPESSNFVGYPKRTDHINNVGKPHTLSMDHWIQMKEKSEDSNKVIKEYDNATRLFGKKPTTKQILEMARLKGVTYQRRGNDGANKSYQNIPKAITPPIAYLSVDLGNWISNAKVLVSISELIKVPSQKEKLLKAINAPNERGLIKYQGKSKEHPEDLSVMLHSMDWTKEENPPFFVYLEIKGLVLHMLRFFNFRQ